MLTQPDLASLSKINWLRALLKPARSKTDDVSVRGGDMCAKRLYMAELSVIARRKLFRACPESMKAAGKPVKTVVVAIARKRLTLLNPLATRNEIFSFEKIGTLSV